MIYLGVDPGECTGLFVLRLNEFAGRPWEHLQVKGLVDLHYILEATFPNVVVCEGFDRRMKAGNIEPIIKHIGVVELYCQMYNVPLEIQSASYGKAFWDNNKLKRVGAYSTGMKHANDAARHVLQYLSNKGTDKRFINMLKPEDFTE